MFLTVNFDNFNEQVLNAKGVVLVNVWAGWSKHCRQMSTIMCKLKNLLDEQDSIVEIDWDQEKQLVNNLEVYGIPTLLIFSRGTEIARYSGIAATGDLMTKIVELKNSVIK